MVDACKSAGALEAVHDDLETVAGYLAANEGTAAFLANPVVAEEKKKEILKKLAGEASFHAFTTNFMQLLVDKKRMSQLSAIIDEFEALFCEATDTQVATVTSAVKLENEQQFMIEEVARDDWGEEHQVKTGS